MRVNFHGKDFEVRVQERRVMFAEFIHKGEVVAAGHAIHAPQDPYRVEEGEKVAVGRAMKELGARMMASPESAQAVADLILAKLKNRREVKAREAQRFVRPAIVIQGPKIGGAYESPTGKFQTSRVPLVQVPPRKVLPSIQEIFAPHYEPSGQVLDALLEAIFPSFYGFARGPQPLPKPKTTPPPIR
jgi:hypothetical protein